MLKLEKIINKGGRRLCLYHPENPDKCVKVAMNHRHTWQLQNELDAYKKVRELLRDFIPEYEENLVETNLGPGLVCDLITDDDGSPSQWLYYYIRDNKLTPELKEQLKEYARIVAEHGIPLYDPNPCNFLVQNKGGKQRIVFSDMKSYNDYKPWTYLHLEKHIPWLKRCIVKKRMNVLLRKVGLPEL